MKKEQFVVTTLGSLLLFPTYSNAKSDKPLNIIFIMADDHTQQTISCYSDRYGKHTTPNIDKLAEEGVKFNNSFVANSISGPSRACMLTGKHSHKNGKTDNMHGNRFDGTQQTFPKLLQKAGYQTAMIGKWHLESNPTGFDYWDILPGQGNYYTPVMYTDTGKTVYPKQYVTDLITNKSIDWLEKRDTKRPFCLFVHHKATHRNFMAKLTDLYAFEDRDYPIPENFWDNYKNRQAAAEQEMSIQKHYTWDYDLKVTNPNGKPDIYSGYYFGKYGTFGRMSADEKKVWKHFYDSIQNDLYKRNLKGKELAEWKYQRYVKDYLKTAKSLDDNIGRLMAYLKEHHLLENTLIVYTSDQGFYMGEHGWFDKRFMYEESMRTPLIMRLPKRFKKHGEIDYMVQNIDHAPTFLEIAGVEVPADIQGESYLWLLKDSFWDKFKCKNKREALYYHFYEFPAEHMAKRHYGIRTKRYKLIHFYNNIDKWELYDLKKDPTEMQNLIDNPKYEKKIKQLKKQLWDLQLKYDDPIRFKINK